MKTQIIATFLFLLCWLPDGFAQRYYKNGVGYITAISGIPMRKSPGLSGEKIMVMPSGKEIKVLSEPLEPLEVEGVKGYWRQVSYNGQTGYAFDGFITRYEPYSESGRNTAITKETEEESCGEQNSNPLCRKMNYWYADEVYKEELIVDGCDWTEIYHLPGASVEETFVWLRKGKSLIRKFTLDSPVDKKIVDIADGKETFITWQYAKDEKGYFKEIHITSAVDIIDIRYSADGKETVVEINHGCM